MTLNQAIAILRNRTAVPIKHHEALDVLCQATQQRSTWTASPGSYSLRMTVAFAPKSATVAHIGPASPFGAGKLAKDRA